MTGERDKEMETLLSICIGIGLSAACGFRVFVPLLMMSIAAKAGHLTLAPGFEWINTYPAMITFGAATALEIAGYYIPWVDNVLDTIAAPAAVVAGVIVMASMVSEISPFLRWSLAVIGGGGVAGIVQTATGLTRMTSTTVTAGLGNFMVSTAEAAGSFVLSLLAIVVPVLAVFIVIAIFVYAAWKFLRKPSRESMV